PSRGRIGLPLDLPDDERGARRARRAAQHQAASGSGEGPDRGRHPRGAVRGEGLRDQLAVAGPDDHRAVGPGVERAAALRCAETAVVREEIIRGRREQVRTLGGDEAVAQRPHIDAEAGLGDESVADGHEEEVQLRRADVIATARQDDGPAPVAGRADDGVAGVAGPEPGADRDLGRARRRSGNDAGTSAGIDDCDTFGRRDRRVTRSRRDAPVPRSGIRLLWSCRLGIHGRFSGDPLRTSERQDRCRRQSCVAHPVANWSRVGRCARLRRLLNRSIDLARALPQDASPMSTRIALYPGSFDPPTNGHLSIIQRGLKMFDGLIVAVLKNPAKDALFSVDERVELLRGAVDGDQRVQVKTFSGLLVKFAEEQGVNTVLRGLRAVSDFEYEFQMANMNRKLDPGIETLFMMTGEDYFYISSRFVRDVARLGGDVSGLVPPNVLKALKKRFK